jgi:drug/metabolite transporter (DMT)-like permease
MTAILGGLGAAVMWAAANLVSSRSAKIIGEDSTLAWMMLVGLVVATPLVVASGPLPEITTPTLVWLVGSGLGSVVGLAFLYRGLRIGKVGVVTALGSTEGALAAVVSVVRGESLPPLALVMLGVIAVGIVAVGLASRPSETAPEGIGAVVDADGEDASAAASAAVARAATLADELRQEARAVAFGVAAALCFGLAIYSTGQAGQAVPPFVAVMPARIAGVVGVLLPLALLGRLRLSRRAVPMVVLIGLGEVFGNAAYVLGARESVAIAAVMASQYGAVAAVAAFFLLGERLSRTQRLGIVIIAIGVAVLSAVRT